MKRFQSCLCTAGSYILWGTLPLFWRLFSQISSFYLLAWRMISSVVFCSLLLFIRRDKSFLRSNFKSPRILFRLLICSILVLMNFAACTYAYVSGHILESSLGNFLCPILTFLISAVVLHEKSNIFQKTAIVTAVIGVMISVVSYGDIPYISLCIAVPFSIYGVLKKKLKHIDSILSTTIENTMMLPVMLILWFCYTPNEICLLKSWQIILLIFSGIATSLPMLLFAQGVKNISFITLGFIQYISPVLSMIIAISTGEKLSISRRITFIMIGIAVVWFLIGTVVQEKQQSTERKENSYER